MYIKIKKNLKIVYINKTQYLFFLSITRAYFKDYTKLLLVCIIKTVLSSWVEFSFFSRTLINQTVPTNILTVASNLAFCEHIACIYSKFAHDLECIVFYGNYPVAEILVVVTWKKKIYR